MVVPGAIWKLLLLKADVVKTASLIKHTIDFHIVAIAVCLSLQLTPARSTGNASRRERFELAHQRQLGLKLPEQSSQHPLFVVR